MATSSEEKSGTYRAAAVPFVEEVKPPAAQRGPCYSCPFCAISFTYDRPVNPLDPGASKLKKTTHWAEKSLMPEACHPGNRVKMASWRWYWPPSWKKGRCAREGHHLHQSCHLCGARWTCETFDRIGAS